MLALDHARTACLSSSVPMSKIEQIISPKVLGTSATIALIGLSLLLLAGCAGDPSTDGGPSDGDVQDSDAYDGEPVDGDVPDSDMTDGGPVDGDAPDSDTVDGDATDGDLADTEVPGDPVTVTIGPEGGEVVLADGTTFRVPSDALPGDIDITMIPADAEDTPWDEEGFVRVGHPFRIEPAMVFGRRFEIVVPVSRLPEGRLPRDVVLVISSEGHIEGSLSDDGTTRLPAAYARVHPMWSTVRADGDRAVFDGLSTSAGTVYQPMVLGPIPEAKDGELGTQIGASCSEALENLGLPVPEDIDDFVSVEYALDLKVVMNHALLPPAQQFPFREAVDRYIARTCTAIHRAYAYYRAEMGIPHPTDLLGSPHDVRVTIAWDQHEPGGGCITSPGHASGEGITMFMNMMCDWPFTGWQAARAIPDAALPCNYCDGYNTPPVGADGVVDVVDSLEYTLAHELFHWLEDWSNLETADGVWGIESQRGMCESWAQMAAEECYDEVPGAAGGPTRLWDRSYWDESYDGHPFFRWVDWSQDTPSRHGSVLRRLLGAARRRADDAWPCIMCDTNRIMFDDLDAALAEMFPSRAGFDRNVALADFALDYLYLHRFERARPASPTFDRYPDVVGDVLDEEGNGQLWGGWATGGGKVLRPDRMTITDPVGVKVSPATRAALLKSYPVAGFGSAQARTIDIDLRGLPPNLEDAPVRLKLTAVDPAGASVRHVALRLVEPAGDEYVLHQREDSLGPGATGTSFIMPASWFGKRYVMVLTNVGDATVNATLDVEEVDEMGLALASFDGGVTGLDLESPSSFGACAEELESLVLGDTFRSAVTRIFVPYDGFVISYPYNRLLRFFDRTTCDEAGIVAYAPGGPGPMAMEVTPDGTYLVVASHDPTDPCAAGQVSVVDLVSSDIVASVALLIGAGDIVLVEGLDGIEALVTQPGHTADCFSSFLRSVVVDDLIDAGIDAPPELVTSIPIGGTAVHLPTRLARTRDRRFAVWTTRNSSGRIGLMDAIDHSYVVFDPEDPVDAPWDTPEDVAVVDHGGRLRIYFINAWETIFFDDPTHPCLDLEGIGTCSVARWLDYDPVTGDLERSGERTLPYALANRIAVTPNGRIAYVTHANRSAITVLDLGSGAFEMFRLHPTTPFLDAEPWPIDIWMP